MSGRGMTLGMFFIRPGIVLPDAVRPKRRGHNVLLGEQVVVKYFASVDQIT